MELKRIFNAHKLGSTFLYNLKLQSNYIGKVHSVFKNVINLDFNTGELISLIDYKTVIMQAAAISIDWDQVLNKIRPNAVCVFLHTTKELYIDSSITILLQGAKIWGAKIWQAKLNKKTIVNNNILDSYIDTWEEQVSEHWLIKEIFQYKNKEPTKINKILGSRILTGLTLLIEAIKTHNVKQLKLASHTLCGLGYGLTPSGDDMLIGWLFGNFIRQNLQQNKDQNTKIKNKFFKTFKQSIDINQATNLISATYLKQACRKEFSKSFHNLYHAIFAGSEQLLLQAMLEIKASGHSSGEDTLLGIFCGLFNRLPSKLQKKQIKQNYKNTLKVVL